MHRHGGKPEGDSADHHADGYREERLGRGHDPAVTGTEPAADLGEARRSADPVEAGQAVEKEGRCDQREEEVLQARFLPLSIGPLQRQEDVGRDRHQLQAGEEEDQIVGRGDQRQAGEEEEERPCLFAGAIATRRVSGSDRAAELIPRLHERQARSGEKDEGAHEDSEIIERERPRRHHRPGFEPHPGPAGRRGDADEGHEPSLAQSTEGSAEIGHEGGHHEREFWTGEEESRERRLGHGIRSRPAVRGGSEGTMAAPGRIVAASA